MAFPFPAYPVQVSYMTAVIEACETGKHALLESPTGTGKTLALLCSSLSWLFAHRESATDKETVPGKIVYLSRTHSQLIQVVRELKRTVYAPVTVSLGSRDQLCINPQANSLRGAQLNLSCKRLRKRNACPYHKGKSDRVSELRRALMDIEELYKYGQDCGVCPFQLSRELLPHAELVLMPYNYVLDHRIRSTIAKTLRFQNAVIIFDEAHNVPRVAEDASSFDISVSSLRKCMDEIKQIRAIVASLRRGEDKYQDMRKEADGLEVGDLSAVERGLDNFAAYLQAFLSEKATTNDKNREEPVFEGRLLFDLFLQGTCASPAAGKKRKPKKFSDPVADFPSQNYLADGISPENYQAYLHTVRKCVEVLSTQSAGMALDWWAQVVSTVYSYHVSGGATAAGDSIDDFKLVVCSSLEHELNEDDSAAAATVKPKKSPENVLKVYCFNAGIGLAHLLRSRPRTLILTSGTLSPMDALERELRVVFPIKLETGHVIGKDQVSLQIVPVDSEGNKFNFSYKKREGPAQIAGLGHFLKEVCKVTPGGILVFFSCYRMLQHCLKAWEIQTLPDIEKSGGKKVFREQKTSGLNQKVLAGYRAEITEGTGGAILFAVCRGKISEGLDFADEAARLVIVVGIPFPSLGDRRVSIRESYLDEHAQELGLTGKQWYLNEAVRAVNQSIGRVIRHKYDYGAILLIDSRFHTEGMSGRISKWLRENVTVARDTEHCIDSLYEFFTRMQKACIPTLPKQAPPPPSKKQRPFRPASKIIVEARKLAHDILSLPTKRPLHFYCEDVDKKPASPREPEVRVKLSGVVETRPGPETKKKKEDTRDQEEEEEVIIVEEKTAASLARKGKFKFKKNIE